MTDLSNLQITDHALIRFMERVVGVNIAAMELLMRETLRASHALGDGYVRGPAGEHYLVSRDGRVVTVLDRDSARAHRANFLRWQGNRRDPASINVIDGVTP